jgi:hypothetical protein
MICAYRDLNGDLFQGHLFVTQNFFVVCEDLDNFFWLV